MVQADVWQKPEMLLFPNKILQIAVFCGCKLQDGVEFLLRLHYLVIHVQLSASGSKVQHHTKSFRLRNTSDTLYNLNESERSRRS